MNIDEIKEKLKKVISEEKIYIEEPMSKHTTFRVGGNADIFIKAATVLDVMNVVAFSKNENIPLTVIGNGSNVLVKDKGIRGIVLKICTENYEIIKEKEVAYVVADSGMLNAKLANILSKDGIAGFEFAAGIPGTVGGSVYMNAGAHGLEYSNIVEETIYLDLDDNKIKVLTKDEHEFSYRHSAFQNKNAIILNTKFKLTYGNSDEIYDKIVTDLKTRVENQPLDYPSAGSTFKRGEDYISAKLIDECNLKGISVGDAEVSNKHAGFIINKGNATAEDILKLIEIVKETVLEKTGKELKMEVRVLGE